MHAARRIFMWIIITAMLLVMAGTGPSKAAAAADHFSADESTAVADLATLISRPAAVVDCADTTCPASAVAGLDKCVERADFCVYYATGSTTESEANWAADQVQAYWNRFTSLGFNAPKHSGQLEVYITADAGCNGGTGWSSNAMSTYAGCWDLGDEIAQKVIGHELTHRVQYSYDTSIGAPIQTKFLKEGTARASEDNWFTNIDHLPITAGGSTYCNEASGYLAATNTNLSALWYKACVWWRWAAEQYGTTLTEPERGVDFFGAVYQENTAGYSSIAAVNRALDVKAPGVDFDESFEKFAVVTYAKDLTGLPDSSYNIDDEDAARSPGSCGSVAPDDKGAISVGTPRQWNNELISQYGSQYYQAAIGASCPVISASFHQDSGTAFYHVITQSGTTYKHHVQGRGTNWTQAFVNDGVTKVVAIAGSTNPGAQVDVTLDCASPQLDIKLPNTGAKAHVQANTKFLAQVLVTNGSPTGPVVAGLTNSDFAARVGGVNAAVTGGGFIQEQYWLVVRAPSGLADGTYDLEVMLEEPGTSTVVDTDTEFQSIIYSGDLVDHVLVIDRSGSMGTPIEPTDDKLIAAKDAADFYVDITRNNDGLAVVAYNHDVDPTPFNMQSVNVGVRTDAKNYIDDWSTPNGIYPDGATSIGDGVFVARNQRVGSPTGNPLCSFVLLSDGMENTPQYWATVKTDVQATGCPVTTIAFGPASNEMLMQSIALDTGGLFFYNDVYVSSPVEAGAVERVATDTVASAHLDLADVYEYAQERSEGRQRLLLETGRVGRPDPPGQVATHEVMIDDSVAEAIFALDWYERWYALLEMQLVAPSGEIYDHEDTVPYTFPDPFQQKDGHATHVGWRIPNPKPGTWKLIVTHLSSEESIVPYQVLVSGQTSLTLDLLLPDRLGMGYVTGNRFPIYAFLSGDAPIPNVPVQVIITAPDGLQTMLPLFDDGAHGDGAAGDGFYANVYTRLNQSEAVQPPDEEGSKTPVPQNEGGYRVRAVAAGGDFTREALGGFSVLAGKDVNGNGLPDAWEKTYRVSDPNGDPDLDYLLTGDEYWAGTDPTDSDTDGGGENDGSEVDRGLDPLDPADDQIAAPDFFQSHPLNGAALLTYDVKTEYAKLELWRAPSADGPWNLRQAELPLGGIYEDPAANDTTLYYRLIAEDAETASPGHRSRVLEAEPVTPSIDPVPPQALILIDDGARTTSIRAVTLSLVPYEYEPGDPDGFSDIVAAQFSNSADFSSASWQTIDPDDDVAWEIEAAPGGVATVYARFRDAHDNESVVPEVDTIRYEPGKAKVYLPIIMQR